MAKSPDKFAQLLTEAIHKIRLRESREMRKTVRIVQDELGFALGRDGGSSVEYWRKGHIPARLEDLEKLARELVRRGGLGRDELQQFLFSADHPSAHRLADELFPPSYVEELAPFVVGPPITYPRQFFGREQALKRIFNLWQRFPLQNVAVIGHHRSGKTSLLRYIQNITRADPSQLRPGQRTDWLSQPDRYQWVYIDFQNVQMSTQARLLRHILIQLELPQPDPCNLHAFIDVVSQNLQTPAVIMMDEIAAGLAAPELDQQFWWSLRSLGSNLTDGKMAFLLTAPESPAMLANDYGKPSPFFNIFGHTLQLGPLAEAEARELIDNSPVPFPAADTAWILVQSGRWPALLQILCDTRLTALEEGQSGQAWQDEGLRRIAPVRYLLETQCR